MHSLYFFFQPSVHDFSLCEVILALGVYLQPCVINLMDWLYNVHLGKVITVVRTQSASTQHHFVTTGKITKLLCDILIVLCVRVCVIMAIGIAVKYI